MCEGILTGYCGVQVYFDEMIISCAGAGCVEVSSPPPTGFFSASFTDCWSNPSSSNESLQQLPQHPAFSLEVQQPLAPSRSVEECLR